MSQETAAKKDTQRLQRAIVEGLEDVKAQDIQVFNTEHLSPLFERVIVATGSSNRQTRALAASVRDAVRDAGFGKPRIEGEENGEWIIVDCGPAVAHIMQPTIRTYYHLEEIWGDKPVRLKLGAPKPAIAAAAPAAAPARNKAPARSTDDAPMLRRSSAARSAQKAADAEAKKAKEQKAPTRKKPAGRSAAGKSAAGRTPARTPAKSAPGRSATAKPNVVKKVAAPASKAAPAKKAAAKKAPAKKSAPRKPAPKSRA